MNSAIAAMATAISPVPLVRRRPDLFVDGNVHPDENFVTIHRFLPPLLRTNLLLGTCRERLYRPNPVIYCATGVGQERTCRGISGKRAVR